MIYAACPNCGFGQQTETLGMALQLANEHNASCKEQREKPAKRERFMSAYTTEEREEWRRRL